MKKALLMFLLLTSVAFAKSFGNADLAYPCGPVQLQNNPYCNPYATVYVFKSPTPAGNRSVLARLTPGVDCPVRARLVSKQIFYNLNDDSPMYRIELQDGRYGYVAIGFVALDKGAL
jgi:hypothetical protein